MHILCYTLVYEAGEGSSFDFVPEGYFCFLEMFIRMVL